MDMSLLIPKGDTLVTYFVLPMLGINKNVFGRKFKTSYLSQGEEIYVELKSETDSKIYASNNNWLYDVNIDETFYSVFLIPEDKRSDLELFKKGLYSQISRDTKKLIYRTSTLPYNKSMSDFKVTHPILHALDNTKVLRKFLEQYLNVKYLSVTGELIDAPTANWYIEERLKQD